MILNKVSCDNLCLEFNNPFLIEYKHENIGYTYDNKELDIYLYGESLEELKMDFEENIIVAWKLYVECNESELNPGAIKLRNKLKQLVKTVKYS